MLCEKCGERSAEIHLVQIINGTRIEGHLCRQCAGQLMPFGEAGKALRMSLSLEGGVDPEEMFRNLFRPLLPELYLAAGESLKCPHCGGDLEPDELFGKAQGSELGLNFSGPAFGDVMESRQGSAERTPDLALKIEAAPDSREKELDGLKRELVFVLRGERYERAAEIRDRIKELEKNIEEKTKGA